MKKAFLFAVVLIFGILAFISCTNGPSDAQSLAQKYTREYWGEWKKMDQSETWEISSTSIRVNGTELGREVSLSKPSENVISVTDNKITYCLYAVRTASSSIQGSVSKDDGSKGLEAGWLSVVVENMNDRYDVTNTMTDSGGRFSAEKLIPGEDYRITIGETSLTVRPAFDGEDIGNIVLRSGVNFKVTVSNPNEIMFAGSEYYSMDLVIENIGDVNCTAATYALEGDEGLEVINSYSEGSLLRTVAAGEKKIIPLRVRCEVPETETAIRKLNLAIRDKDGTIWNDSVSLKFYKETVKINVVSESGRPISGVIIGAGRTYTITNRDSYSIDVPVTEEGYLLVFSGAIANASRNTEAAYSIGVDRPACGASDLLKELGIDTNSYEPNDDENHAKSILFGDTVVSYLFENDIDYYYLSDHEWDEGFITKQATCTEDGSMVFTCIDCGKTKEQVIASPGHVLDKYVVTKEVSCTENGIKSGKCIVCGNDVEVTIPALGHSFSTQWSMSTNYHWHAATCGHDVVSEKAEHSWNNGEVTTEPTNTREGLKTYMCTVCGQTKTEKLPKVYTVGGVGPAGGWVFYDKGYYSDGWRYLEVAPKDLSAEYPWGGDGSFGTTTGIGAGKKNTDLIASKSTSSRANNAAKACLDFSFNGYDDWFLPSKDELYLLYTNIFENDKGDFETFNQYYWSSSEYSHEYYSWMQGFNPSLTSPICYQGEGHRSLTYRVRPVRAF